MLNAERYSETDRDRIRRCCDEMLMEQAYCRLIFATPQVVMLQPTAPARSAARPSLFRRSARAFKRCLEWLKAKS